MTTFEPGARLDLTQGLRRRPRSTAFLARSPAVTSTCGLDVFVQLVIAAITTEPSPTCVGSPSRVSSTERSAPCGSAGATSSSSGTGS